MRVKFDLLPEEAQQVRDWIDQHLALPHVAAGVGAPTDGHLRRGLRHLRDRLSHQLAAKGHGLAPGGPQAARLAKERL
jgi:hypothetical protein